MAAKDGRWRARAEVDLDDAVREKQQQGWNRVLEQQADQKLAALEQEASQKLAVLEQHANQELAALERAARHKLITDYAALIDRWRLLLADVGIGEKEEGPLPPYLGRYLIHLAADPTSAPAVVDRLSDRREAKDNELLQTVVDAISCRDRVNLLETDLAYDAALRRLVDWAGVPLLEPSDQPLPNGTPR
jgi:hypothetical protein